MAECICNLDTTRNLSTKCFRYKRILIYYPSNSKKGIAIKGTNLRVSLEWT
jgi:hypothetical protein